MDKRINRKGKELEAYTSNTLVRKFNDIPSVQRKRVISILEERGDIKKINFKKLVQHNPGDVVQFKPAKNSTKLNKAEVLKGEILKAWADHKRGIEWVMIKVLESGVVCYKKGESVQIAI